MKHVEKYELVMVVVGLAVNAGSKALQAFNASKMYCQQPVNLWVEAGLLAPLMLLIKPIDGEH